MQLSHCGPQHSAWPTAQQMSTEISWHPCVSCVELKESNLNSNRQMPIKSFPTLSTLGASVGLVYL